MSAKGRRPRAANVLEFNLTPRTALLPMFAAVGTVDLPGGIWIDPCAGDGAIIRAVNEVRSDVHWRAFDLDPGHRAALKKLARTGDKVECPSEFVLRPWRSPPADVLVMNPPFSLTMPFLHAALERARWVVMLQRVNWFGSRTRGPWLRAHCPDIYVLEERPSFDGEGTDATEYAWFVWPPGDRVRRHGLISMLPAWQEIP